MNKQWSALWSAIHLYVRTGIALAFAGAASLALVAYRDRGPDLHLSAPFDFVGYFAIVLVALAVALILIHVLRPRETTSQ